MKKVLIAFALLLCFCACRNNETNFRLEGNLTGFKGKSVYFYSDDEDYPRLDTVSVDNGKFIYELAIDTIVPLQLLLKDGAEEVTIFANKSYEVTLSGNANNPSSIKIQGGSLNDEMNQFRTSIATIKNKEKITAIAKDYILKNPESRISEALLYKYFIREGKEMQEIQPLIQRMNKRLKSKRFIQNILENEDLAKKSLIDSIAPEFSFAVKNAPDVKLADFSNKILLIQFWASWNEESIQKMNIGKGLVDNYGKDRFAVLNVALDMDDRDWKMKTSSDSIGLRTNVCDNNGWEGSMVKAYGIHKVPSNILINKKKIIIGRDLFDNELTERLNALMPNTTNN